MNAQRIAELRRVRANVHTTKGLPWMKGVLATAIGPKIVQGRFTDTPALHFLVHKKLPGADLTLKRIIPSQIDGHPTDIVRRGGELLPAAAFVPAAAVDIGYGTALEATGSHDGTLAAVGSQNGQPVLITSAHWLPDNGNVYRRDAPRIQVGTFAATPSTVLSTAKGSELYGDWAEDQDEDFRLDVAVIAAEAGLTLRGGLPGASPFSVAPNTATLVAGLPTSSVLSYGSGTGGWRQGTVTSLWPRLTSDAVTGLCLVDHDPVSQPGDSGSLWLLRSGGDFLALGLHWGLLNDLAFVTDLTVSLPLLQIDGIDGNP